MLTFICVIFSIAAVTAIGDAFSNRIDLTQFNIMGFTINVGQMLGAEIETVLETISNVLFAITLIGLLPKILTAVAFWLIKTGSGEGEKSTKTSILGLNLFKIKFLYETVMAMIMMCVIGVIGIVAVRLSFGNTTALLICVAALALVIGYYFLVYRYYVNFTVMLVGVSNTMRTNVNMIVKSGMVITFNYFAAVFLILGSFGNGILGLAVGICDALCVIFVNRLFASYDNLCGYAEKEATKEVMERLKTDPALEKTALALGVMRAYAPATEQKPSIIAILKTTIFGSTVAYIDDETLSSAPQSTEVKTSAPATTATTAASQPSVPTYTRTPDVTDELSARHLALFSQEETVGDSRYSICGERAYAQSTEPVSLSWAQVVVDGISEKKILRTAFVNNAPLAVKEIKFTVIPKTNESSSLGIFKNISLSCSAESGQVFGAEYGLILPDNTTCGCVKVTYVEFTDGMFRDKEGGEVFFSTAEKTAFDTNLYLSLMKKG